MILVDFGLYPNTASAALTANVTETKTVQLNWAGTGSAPYTLLRGDTQIYTGNGTSFVDTGVNSGNHNYLLYYQNYELLVPGHTESGSYWGTIEPERVEEYWEEGVIEEGHYEWQDVDIKWCSSATGSHAPPCQFSAHETTITVRQRVWVPDVKGMIKKTRIIPAVEGWIPYSYWVDDQYGYVTRSTTVTAVIPTAPDTPEIVTPAVNDSYGGAVPSFVPIVKARDANGDVLTVAYYVDGETTPRQTRTISNTATAQSVSFDTLNISNLSAGKHTFRVTVRDQLHLAERTVDFYIDQSPPTLGTVAATSTASSVTLNGSATDTPAGLASMPYRYTIGGVASAWTTQTSSTRTSLAANTLYSVLFEARDKLEHTSSKSLTLYTRAETPTVSVAATAETTATIKLNDGNPAVTQYQLKAGAKYVDASGQLVNAPTWIKPTNKQVTLNGLSPNAGYSIQAMAKNEEGHATAWSGAVTATTKATPPSSITSTMNQSSIQVSWAPTSGATGYDIEVDGTVVNNGVATSYSHTGLQPDTRHTYRIRVKNAGGTGEWSQVFTVFTWPNPPTTPTNLAGSAVQTVTTLIWDAAARAESYEIEADGKIVPVGNVLTFNHTGLQPETDHTYRIRAKNRGGLSGWSQPFTIKTLPYPPETPPNLRADLSIYSVAVAWDAPERAVAYEIEVDGLILENGESTTYLHEGLEPLSGHTYRVRAKNAGGKSEWTEPLDVTTHPEKPIAPSNILTMSDASSVTLMWYNVPNADLYEIEIDGKAGGSVTEPQFVHSGLPANSKHSYRIRAKNISGYSPWSVPVTMGTLPAGEGASEALTNVVAVVTNSFISVSWDTVAPNATYEIEVDGQIHDIDSDTV
jgi:hypothetical protein